MAIKYLGSELNEIFQAKMFSMILIYIDREIDRIVNSNDFDDYSICIKMTDTPNGIQVRFDDGGRDYDEAKNETIYTVYNTLHFKSDSLRVDGKLELYYDVDNQVICTLRER